MVLTGVASPLVILTSPIIFAGAAQVVAVQLLGSDSGVALVVFTVLIINARHLLYSASMQPHWAGWTRGQRLAGAFLLSDPGYAVAITRHERNERR